MILKRKKKNLILPKAGVVFFVIFFFLMVALFSNFNTNLRNEENALTGGAVSTEGGNVTYVNASKIDYSGYWQGFFGEITVNASSAAPSATAQSGNVTKLDLILPCLGDELYVSTHMDVTLEGMAAGTKEAVDVFLNLGNSHPESGSKIFTTTKDFIVFSTLITNVPTTFMEVPDYSDTPFALGIVNETNQLIFVSNISLDTIGFDGKAHDYQMMVPVNQSSLTYYFFSDCSAQPSAPVQEAPSATGGAAGGAGPLIRLCGDKVCQVKETCISCPADCGVCPNVSKEIPSIPKNITVEEALEKKEALIYVPYPLNRILNILEQQLFTLRGMAVLLFGIMIFLIIISWKIVKRKERPPRLVFLRNK